MIPPPFPGYVVRTLLAGTILSLALFAGADDEFVPKNSQRPGDEPPAPGVMTGLIALPDGFEATLFAAEPDVRQPVSMTFDDRGRLWVTEGYSYGEWKREGRDRILILDDVDGDGRFDERKVFWSGADHLTSALPGFGGVWMLDLPDLWFIPDRDGDDIPDGPAERRVTGFALDAEHNNASGLSWGPDGWLWGRHGILTDSMIGLPEWPEDRRLYMSSGLWRYHPVSRKLERVLDGMTNPWGHDWDAHGHLFLSGNVNGHFWHGIPGVHYERMFGAGGFPFVYDRLTMMAERPHYPGAADWQKVWNVDAVGRATDNAFGGGHSHCGAMVYLGTNWPEEFRGDLFMCNTHGRRVNRDSIEEGTDTFTSRYKGDMATFGTPWFRGTGIVQAPDGSVLVSDWCDLGECHDSDGVHRTSGRIYGIRHGVPERPGIPSGGLRVLDDAAMARLQASENEWLVRMSRRLLQERATERALEEGALAWIRKRFADPGLTPRDRLRALWVLHSCGVAGPADYASAMRRGNPHEASWGLRLIVESGAPEGTVAALIDEAPAILDHPLTRLYAAGQLGRMAPRDARPVAERLLREPAGPVLELATWHGVEPVIAADPIWGARVVAMSGSARLRRFAARRIADGFADPPVQAALAGAGAGSDAPPASTWAEAMTTLVQADAQGSGDRLAGILDALRGQRGLHPPDRDGRWARLLRKLADGGADDPARMAAEIAVIFGDESIIRTIDESVWRNDVPPGDRVRALETLVAAGHPELRSMLDRAYADPVLRRAAIAGFQGFADDAIARTLVRDFPGFSPDERVTAVETLAARESWALVLAEGLRDGIVPRSDISASQAQRMSLFGNDDLRRLLSEHWGAARSTPAEKRARIEALRAQLTSADPGAADPSAGQAVFRSVCAACHRLFGEGGTVGPDLTGGGRRELDYLLENVVDPSASVPTDYWMSQVTLSDGRVLSGTIPEQTASMLVLRTAAGEQRIDRKLVESIERTYTSTMPEGLFDILTIEQVRDLVAYLALDAPPDADAPDGPGR